MRWVRVCSVTQSCLTLSNPMDSSPTGSCVHGIFQARICEWVAISSSRGSSWPRDQTCISYIGGWILYHWTTWEALQCQNNNDQNRIISPWTWDGLLVLHSRKYFLFKNPLAYLCILSYSCPALPFVHTNFSSWWQGEIFNWKVNNCRHVEEIDYEKWSKTAENSVSHKNFMWIPSALAFCAPGRYNLEQFGWLNKSSGTN